MKVQAKRLFYSDSWILNSGFRTRYY